MKNIVGLGVSYKNSVGWYDTTSVGACQPSVSVLTYWANVVLVETDLGLSHVQQRASFPSQCLELQR